MAFLEKSSLRSFLKICISSIKFRRNALIKAIKAGSPEAALMIPARLFPVFYSGRCPIVPATPVVTSPVFPFSRLWLTGSDVF